MTLAKMARKSNLVEGEKNKRAFNLEKVNEMEFFRFIDKDKLVKGTLKYIIEGGNGERVMFGNNDAEIIHLEDIFDKWVSLHTPATEKTKDPAK